MRAAESSPQCERDQMTDLVARMIIVERSSELLTSTGDHLRAYDVYNVDPFGLKESHERREMLTWMVDERLS